MLVMRGTVTILRVSQMPSKPRLPRDGLAVPLTWLIELRIVRPAR